MLRIINKLKVLNITAACNSYSTFNPALAPVKRCHRKPRWIPVAKSKRFRVPERPKISEDETKEILRLHNNYRNNVKSLKRYLVQKHCTIYQASLDPEEILKHFKEDFQTCMAVNDKWNEEVKVIREERVARKHAEELESVQKDIENTLIKQEQIYELAEELVKKQKEASVNFITPENIEEAIDKALAGTVDYNFAIDVNGEKIFAQKNKEKVSLKQ